MTFAIVIPARFASQRYPGKPLAPIRGANGAVKPLIQRSWEAAIRVSGARQVIVATDDSRIADVARGFGATVAMTPEDCANGTERCAAALGAIDDDVDLIVNLQGDAPLTPAYVVEALVSALADDPRDVATPVVRADPELHRRLLDDQRHGRVGGTTAVGTAGGRALYFSKSVVPHVPEDRVGDPAAPVRMHIGVYAYRRPALLHYAATPPCLLETLEGLEQLRFLEAGVAVRLVDVAAAPYGTWELNNPIDLPVIEQALAAGGID